MAKARTRDTAPPQPKARSDAYVGLLFLALLAQIVGAVFLYLDYSQYPESNPKAKVDAALRKVSAPATGGPAAPPGGPVVPPGKGPGPGPGPAPGPMPMPPRP